MDKNNNRNIYLDDDDINYLKNFKMLYIKDIDLFIHYRKV